MVSSNNRFTLRDIDLNVEDKKKQKKKTNFVLKARHEVDYSHRSMEDIDHEVWKKLRKIKSTSMDTRAKHGLECCDVSSVS